MQEIRYPYFTNGRILKIEMLESLRDFPRDVLCAYGEDLSDGIVFGLTPKVDKEVISFSQSLVKHKGEFYALNDIFALKYGVTETEVIIKLNFCEASEEKDYRIRQVLIEIDKNFELLENQLEIGRFKLKSGAYLRSEYQDLYDFTTEYNTLNVVNVLYAGYQKPTLSNLVLKYFATEALAVKTQNAMDISFCLTCLNSGRVERDVILNYVAYRQNEAVKDIRLLTNEELHKKLVRILEDIKRENKSFKGRGLSERKIVVD